jgi:SAM-dependent methyltransferase
VFPSARITAVDLNTGQLRYAREYCVEFADRIAFLEYDFYSSAPLLRDEYDTAIAFEVFMHHPLEIFSSVLARLDHVASYLINYDWSKEWSGHVSKHV